MSGELSKEKEILIDNRIRLNREFEDERLKMFTDYLDREAEVVRIQERLN